MPTHSPVSPLPIPEVDIDIDEPVAVIPAASVAPLEGPPDGERINIYTLAPADRSRGADALARDAVLALRERVLENPFAYCAGAFLFGFVLARIRR